jgi:hypothetical protein
MLVCKRKLCIFSKRSLKLLKDILEKVGTQSEFHELREIMLTSRQDYIWGIARMRVCTPVLDRIRLNYSATDAGIAYLHYEKIGRICLFCGVMFHTIQNCHLRQQIITDKICKRQDVEEVPFQRFGQWIVDHELIPPSFAVHGEGCNPVFSTFQHPELSRFQSLFDTDRKRKGKASDSSTPSPILLLQGQRNYQSQKHALTATSSAMAMHQNLDKGTVHSTISIHGCTQGFETSFTNVNLHEGHLTQTATNKQITDQSFNNRTHVMLHAAGSGDSQSKTQGVLQEGSQTEDMDTLPQLNQQNNPVPIAEDTIPFRQVGQVAT